MKKINIKEKILNIKKTYIIITIVTLILVIISIVLLCLNKEEVGKWISDNILNKNITEEDITTINLKTDKTNEVYVYSKYIAILSEKVVTLYNNYGEKINDIKLDISNGISDTNGKFLIIGENKGNKISLIMEKTYLWSATLEGQILQVHVNQNGYVAVITTDSTNKSILTFYNSSGRQLFKSYFSETRIIDVSISKDNKYIAIGELDTSGSLIQSNIKIISVENTQSDAENSIIYTYNAENGNLITSVKYQSKGQLACMYDKSISIINNNQNKEILTIKNDDITYMSNNFSENIVYIQEKTTGIFNSKSNIKIINTNNNQEKTYELDDRAKEIYAKDDILAVNAGTEIYFFNTNGYLIKKYTSNQEITNVNFSRTIATIIYKDKIMIINL